MNRYAWLNIGMEAWGSTVLIEREKGVKGMSADSVVAAPNLFGSEDITPFDIAKFLALMDHTEVKARDFQTDRREGAKECRMMM